MVTPLSGPAATPPLPQAREPASGTAQAATPVSRGVLGPAMQRTLALGQATLGADASVAALSDVHEGLGSEAHAAASTPLSADPGTACLMAPADYNAAEEPASDSHWSALDYLGQA
jgi:hypothetical protein